MEELPRDPADALARELRQAGAGDLDGVCALWLALTRDHAERDPLYALRPGAEAEVRRLLAAQLADPQVAAFVCGAEPPFPGLAIVRVERAPPIHPETRRGEISDLYVVPAARRRGLGRALAGAAARWAAARGAERLEIRVAADNPEGAAFWRALGFAPHMDVLHRRL